LRYAVYILDESIGHELGGGKSSVGVLDRSVAILSYLAEDGPAALAEVVAGTGIPWPTAHRLLSALETHHLVVRGEEGYSLGSRLLGWGERAVRGRDLVEAARPAFRRLRDEMGERTQLFVREGDQRVCVASVEPLASLKNTVPVGAIMPLERGSAGKVLLAWSGEGFRGGPGQGLGQECRRAGAGGR